ncbi:MAG: S41 family peptidase [Ardenticatenaceae bacterium]|nr:S41 family peptidase [Ardenticatenaceae bacterium]
MEEQKRNWGLIIGGIVGLIVLCAGVAWIGFSVGQRTADSPEPISVTEAIAEIVLPTEETADAAESDAGTAVANSAEETASTNNDAAAAPNTPAPNPTNPPAQSQPRTDVDEIDLDIFYEAWDFIEETYDGDIPANEEILHALIGGSIEALGDDFTRYIEPDVAARLREDMSGSVSGIGAFVRENEDGFFEIVSPIEGQPAELAGLQSGDLVIEVDGQSVVGISFDEVILMVRGPEGTSVTLTIARPDETEMLEFTIVRTTFEVPVVNYEMREDGIAYVQLVEFSRDASGRLETALEEVLAQNPRGLIFDLRNNPGGYLDESVAIADLFLTDGVVLFERNVSGLDRTFTSDNGDLAEEIPIVVLINPGSASASEIVAGAIQDRGRGVLMGQTSFGKGSVQTVRELSDGSELRVTIARWYTPADHTIDKQGITPDIEVEFPLDTPEGEDPQVEAAAEYLLEGE